MSKTISILIRYSSVLVWNAIGPRFAHKRWAGTTLVAASIALIGAVAVMNAWLNEWHEMREQAALAMPAPQIALPAIIVPAVTVPEVTVPAVIVPAVTVPAVTVPRIALPKIIGPDIASREIPKPSLAPREITKPSVAPREITPSVASRELPPGTAPRKITRVSTALPKDTQPVLVSIELEKPKDITVLVSVAMVKNFFSSTGYSLDAVRRGQVEVPRLLQASLPHDLESISHAPDRKAVFLRFMLPYVLQANDRVRQERAKLLSLRRNTNIGEALRPADQIWLDAMLKKYRLKHENFAALILRVDAVPVSLVLAQAAVESGWGTSRFALEGNALFGQWTSVNSRGITPRGREAGRNYKIRAFSHLDDAVDAYLRNLNTHRAYRKFRARRAALRAQNQRIDSVAIATTLTSYSEIGKAYVVLVRRVITQNDLRALDRARLSETAMASEPGA